MELGSRGAGRFTAVSGFGPGAPEDGIADRLLGRRIVVLGREIDDEAANAVCSRLVLLAAENRHHDITLYVNSPGGSPGAGTAIYDTMRWIEPDVATVVHGTAASTALLLLAAGAPGKRTALPHATFLLHQPPGGVSGTAGDVRIRSEQLTRQRREIAGLIARHSGRTVDEVLADSDRDRRLTAAEAVQYGLVDRVADRAGAPA